MFVVITTNITNFLFSTISRPKRKENRHSKYPKCRFIEIVFLLTQDIYCIYSACLTLTEHVAILFFNLAVIIALPTPVA